MSKKIQLPIKLSGNQYAISSCSHIVSPSSCAWCAIDIDYKSRTFFSPRSLKVVSSVWKQKNRLWVCVEMMTLVGPRGEHRPLWDLSSECQAPLGTTPTRSGPIKPDPVRPQGSIWVGLGRGGGGIWRPNILGSYNRFMGNHFSKLLEHLYSANIV